MKKELFKRKKIGEIMVSLGFVTSGQVEAELKTAECRIGEWLVKRGIISEEQLAIALAEQFEFEYADLKGYVIGEEMFEIMPASDVFRMGIVPYGLDGEVLRVVIGDPVDITLADQIERISGKKTEFLLSTKALIEAAQERSGAAAVFLKDVSEHYRNIQQDSAGRSADGTVSLKELAGEANSVTRLINTIVLAAMQKRASDVHLESYESGVRIRYRIDGVLCPATGALDPAHHRALVTRIKVMAKLDIAETRVPQDGHFKLAVNEGETDFRVSVLPAIYGEDVVIRILDKSSIMRDVKGLSIDGLGFGADISKKIRRSINEPYGMILITGPTGSGKTTTLYAALSELNSSEEKIVTIEDPVEYRIPGIVQVAVNEKKNLTFARGLRSMLRHDPDKIVVGEIRDTETAQIAVQSALTGHMVFSTVHANNACDVIGRFSHMGINIYSFISALNCVVAQRLIRLICEKCRAAAPAGAADGIRPDAGEYKDIKWFEGKGCAECGGTGYKGRTAIGEYLFISPEIRRIIMEKKPSDELLKAAVNGGMTTLRKAAIKMGALGLTTISEINRVTFAE